MFVLAAIVFCSFLLWLFMPAAVAFDKRRSAKQEAGKTPWVTCSDFLWRGVTREVRKGIKITFLKGTDSKWQWSEVLRVCHISWPFANWVDWRSAKEGERRDRDESLNDSSWPVMWSMMAEKVPYDGETVFWKPLIRWLFINFYYESVRFRRNIYRFKNVV